MNKYEIRKDSLTYRLMTYFNSHLDWHISDICMLRGVLIKNILIIALLCIVVAFAINGLMFITVDAFLDSGYVESLSDSTDKIPLIIAYTLSIVAGVIFLAICAFVIGMTCVFTTLEGLCWIKDRIYEMIDRNTEPKEPNVIVQMYRSAKDKYCVPVVFVDTEENV